MKYRVIKNFLNEEECERIIKLARPRLTRSVQWGVRTGKRVYNNYRTSRQTFLKRGETALIKSIEKRIAKITKTPIKNGENIQVVKYGKGQYYKTHYDYFNPEYESSRSRMEAGGQRIITWMVYLNDVEEGGETFFDYMDILFTPERGKVIWWYNIKRGGAIDPSTSHEARPVIKGQKWIFTKWIRERTFK